MTFTWKINDIYAKDGLIMQVKYHCSAIENDITVETEGTWVFVDPVMNVEFDQVTEEMVAEWIDVASNGLIKENLQKQIKTNEFKPTHAPWLPQVFTPDI